VNFGPFVVQILQSEEKMVDVTGIEPVTPACKAENSSPTAHCIFSNY